MVCGIIVCTTGGPWGAGCDIFDGQEEQNKYMKFINPHVNEEGIVDKENRTKWDNTSKFI